MSLDGGGISNSPGAQDTVSAMEEDYCLHARNRLQHQWATTGVFHPGVLRHYGITGESSLLRSIKQTRMFNATFGTCFLGHFPLPNPAEKSSSSNSCREEERTTQEDTTTELPFDSLLLGPMRPPEFTARPELARDAWRQEVVSAWDVMQMPSEWCRAMNGVVTEMNWSTTAQRQRIREQLQLASFMCLRAVQVPLPFYAKAHPWCAEDAEDSQNDTDALAMTVTPVEEEQHNIRLACLAADVLLAFIQQAPEVKVWVRCDGCTPAHRYQMQRLRQAVLYGYTRQTNPTNGGGGDSSKGSKVVFRINTPCSVSSSPSCPTASSASSAAPTGTVHTEAVSALMTMLYFSAWHPAMLLPSEWLGEQVVCFECPPAPLLLACMAPHGVAPQQHPRYRPNAATEELQGNTPAARRWSAAMFGEEKKATQEDVSCEANSPQQHDDSHQHHLSVPYNASRRSSPAQMPDMAENVNDVSGVLSSANYSLCDWGESLVLDGQQTPGAATSAGVSAMHTPAPSDTRRSSALQQRYTYVLPDDLHSQSAARWAGQYPPLISVLTFLIELMRRRAFPMMDRGFFDQYPLLNYLYFKAVEEPTRDVFAPYEGQLQLPLQPLGHQLSSGVYEVFERDSRKYRQYREAVFSYVSDWYEAGPTRQHAWQNQAFAERHGVRRQVPMSSNDERVLYLVLLGCGRGPLIDECLNAVSALGVRLRLFAIEKNGPAAAFTRMRWANDPEWAQLAYTFGHTLEVIVADGRHIADAAEAGTVVLPADFGLCDVVVSELLGSFGDNELSPECLEAFHAQLREVQQRRGLSRNAHLTCIPQSYTAWAAPLMSTSLEAAVAEASVKGLTVVPPHCHDRHAALNHTLLVTNLCRGVTLAAPQPCWTFTHRFGEVEEAVAKGAGAGPVAMDRSAHLVFTVPPCGRCSGFAGYFSCVLYESVASPPVTTTIATAPVQRTADMYSWFPCAFTLDPAQRAELFEVRGAAAAAADTEGDASSSAAAALGLVAIHLDLARKTSVAERRVWYEWSVRYGDAATELREKDAVSSNAAVVVHNRDGWASSMLL